MRLEWHKRASKLNYIKVEMNLSLHFSWHIRQLSFSTALVYKLPQNLISFLLLTPTY